MNRYIIAGALALGFTGAASAQGPQDVVTALNNIDDTTNALVAGLQTTGVAYLNGQVETTARSLATTAGGVGVNLSDDTPLEDLGTAGFSLSQQLADAGQPLYDVLEGPASQLADAGAPLAAPLITAINGTHYNLNLNFSAPDLPGLPGAGSVPGLPDLGGLPGLGDLPLDPTMLTDLLGGGLPGMPGAGSVPGLPDLGGLPLSPEILTNFLGNLPIPSGA